MLVVDDDRDLCDSLWDVLHERHFRAGVAHDEAAARAMLQRQNYHVVLIDMKLPKGDGRGVFRLVRETMPQARTVLITGHRGETEEIVSRLLHEGADTVCYKPFDVRKLLATIHELTAARMTNDEARMTKE